MYNTLGNPGANNLPAYTNSSAVNNLTSIAFVGIVVGQLSLYAPSFSKIALTRSSYIDNPEKWLFGRPLGQSQQPAARHGDYDCLYGSVRRCLLSWRKPGHYKDARRLALLFGHFIGWGVHRVCGIRGEHSGVILGPKEQMVHRTFSHHTPVPSICD